MMTGEQARQDVERRRRAQRLYIRRRRVELLLCIALLIVAVIGSTDSGKRQNGAEPDATEQMDATVSPSLPDADPVADEIALYGCRLTGTYDYPFNTIVQDWNSEDVTGFHYHEISATAQAFGGYFPPVVQIYTFIVCKQYGVDYEMVFALIELESKCVYDAEGDGGDSIGYMQIQEKWHEERMHRLAVYDLKNPFQNILVGVDILAEIQEKIIARGTAPEMVAADTLAAYQYGMQGAQRNLWDNGVHLYAYNQAILDRAEELRQETKEGR